MWFFYLFAAVPIIVGAILWLKNRQIVWVEWLGGSAIALAVAILFQIVSVCGMTRDTETWSGKIVKAVHFPEWIEEYQQMHTQTHTDSKGNTHTTTYYTTEHRTHHKHWESYDTLEREHSIDQNKFNEIQMNFGGVLIPETPRKSGFDGGDPCIYVANNTTGYIYPVTCTKSWENRVKAAPSLFSYTQPPRTVPVFEYPKNSDPFVSGRLLGNAAYDVSILEWDRMNARLGPYKKVNVILIGFVGQDSQVAHYQESKWIGGKKNDLVLCYGNKWSYVFGWTEQEIVKKNLQTILLNEKIDDSIIPAIEEEIRNNYTIKNWHKFDYIKVNPPTWAYIVYIIIVILTQTGFYLFAHMNSFNKDGYDCGTSLRDYIRGRRNNWR